MQSTRPPPRPSRAIAKDLIDEIGCTISSLECQPTSPLNVHEMRNSLTRIRALLRLLRDRLGNAGYRRRNMAIRDARRPLDLARDAEVLIQTAHQLQRRTDSVQMKRLVRRLVQHLTEERAAVRLPPSALQKSLTALRSMQHEMRKRTQSLSIVPGDGLVGAYKKCRIAFRCARNRPTDARLHEWRKQVKYLYCETDAMRRHGEERVTPLLSQAALLATELGDDHDLSVLQARVSAMGGPLADPVSIHKLKKRIKSCRATLQRKALRRGERCFRAKPRRVRLI